MSNDKKEIAMEQIVSLIQLSERCEQSFQYDCLLAPLTNNDVDLAYWEDRNKEINNYYTGRKYTCIHPIVDFGTCFNTGIRAGSDHFISGSNKNLHVCDCSFQQEGCAEQAVYNNTCNCDANLPVLLQDTGTHLLHCIPKLCSYLSFLTGIITNSSALPITRMFFGGLNYDAQSGEFLLGRLKCYG